MAVAVGAKEREINKDWKEAVELLRHVNGLHVIPAKASWYLEGMRRNPADKRVDIGYQTNLSLLRLYANLLLLLHPRSVSLHLLVLLSARFCMLIVPYLLFLIHLSLHTSFPLHIHILLHQHLHAVFFNIFFSLLCSLDHVEVRGSA